MCGFHSFSACGGGFCFFIASGELGKYIVTVRKKDVNWYIGGMIVG